MTVEKAIRTALKYETRVHDLYVECLEKIKTPEGRRLFKTLAEEEQEHMDFLQSILKDWLATGRVTPLKLQTSIPPAERYKEGVEKLSSIISEMQREDEIYILKKIIQIESETSDYYKRMLPEIPDEAKGLFESFITAEEGHLAIVRAELDHLTRSGYWFDFQEFTLDD